jgi:hypothetical protein
MKGLKQPPVPNDVELHVIFAGIALHGILSSGHPGIHMEDVAAHAFNVGHDMVVKMKQTMEPKP